MVNKPPTTRSPLLGFSLHSEVPSKLGAGLLLIY